MPAYDFKCDSCHTVQEQFLSYPPPDTVLCPCGDQAPYFPTFYYNSPVNSQRFAPVVIHRDTEGNVRFPGEANARVPEGFQRVELTDFHQIRSFERDMEKKQGVEAEQFRQSRQFFLDGQLKVNREAVDTIARGGAWQGTDERGNIITRHGLSPRGQALYDKMREVSAQKQRSGAKSVSPAFYVDAFTNSSSNREGYYDANGIPGYSRGRK